MESKGEVFMIPKIIHYCWVGNAPKPKSVTQKNGDLFQITQDWILYINMVEFI